VFGATITLGTLLFYLERFYFSCIAPFHSCIALLSNSLCESALIYFLYFIYSVTAIISVP
jgi:hypothetical protein